MKYRSEIDGLRALAVLPVIFFHAGFKTFSGGFIGVEIFFVISGYLICSLIIEEIERKDFNLLSFYERRARRILPALFFVLIITIPFAWVVMLPSQMYDFSKSIIAVSLFLSNFFFWQESGYFNPNIENSPLLHTWSLAVEEQFYLIFPIALIALWRFGKRKLTIFLVFFALISFLLSEWGWRNHPTANFYFSPTRFWELLSGSITALTIKKFGLKGNNFYALIGLFLISSSIFIFDETTPFPSYMTLIPIIGTVLVIIYANNNTYVANYLSFKPLVFIGLISYSAYLVHQPLFSIARINSLNGINDYLMLVLILLTFIIAFVIWKFVETPFRKNHVGLFSQKKIFFYVLVFISLFSFIGWAGFNSSGFKNLMYDYKYEFNEKKILDQVLEAASYNPENMQLEECHIWGNNKNLLDQSKIDSCRKKHNKATLVIGDSHATNLFNILRNNGTKKFLIGITQGGCHAHANLKQCPYRNLKEFLIKNIDNIDKIIYHQSGSHLITDSYGNHDTNLPYEGETYSINKRFVEKNTDFLNNLEREFSLDVVWIGPFLEYRYDPFKLIKSKLLYNVNPHSIKVFEKLNNFLKNYKKYRQIKFYAFDDIFWEPKKVFKEGCMIFRDRDHYSRCGEIEISKSFKINL